jgi:hypothetical protein
VWENWISTGRRYKVYTSHSAQKSIKMLGASVHAYNPSYPEGRDQEDRGSEPTQKNSL